LTAPRQGRGRAVTRDLVRAAEGAADYRSPALARDQLWGMVEGVEYEAASRVAAATALARTAGSVDRARLRVAAERCAEPRLRVELLEVAEVAEDEEQDAPLRTRGALGAR
jgi:hypothetical protein